MSEITVLAVDDSPLILQMVKDYLQDAEVMVLTAKSGKEGLEVLAQIKPEMIISDVVMPEMDGWKFCEAIRKNPDTTDIPFLFLTAEKEVPKRIRGLKLGADDYLTKPFSRQDLLERVQRIADKVANVRRRFKPHFKPKQTALSGHTSHLAMADLLQLMSLNSKTGVLRIEAEEIGKIYFHSGQIIHASLDSVVGLKALYRMLAWKEAHFELEPLEEESVDQTIHEPTQNLLMEGFTQIDEASRLDGKVPGSGEPLKAKTGAATPEDLSDPERQVLQALKRETTLATLLNRLPLSDLQILEATASLTERGLVEVLQPAGAATS
ncbi:MAG: response regulator [Acidobacteriota bacterium]